MRFSIWLTLAVLLLGVLLMLAGTLIGSRQAVAMRVPSDGCLAELIHDLDHPSIPSEVLVCWDGDGTLSLPEGNTWAQFR